LQFLSLNIRNKERRNEILDESFGLISSLLYLVEEVIKSLSFEFSLFIGLKGRSIVDSVDENVL